MASRCHAAAVAAPGLLPARARHDGKTVENPHRPCPTFARLETVGNFRADLWVLDLACSDRSGSSTGVVVAKSAGLRSASPGSEDEVPVVDKRRLARPAGSRMRVKHKPPSIHRARETSRPSVAGSETSGTRELRRGSAAPSSTGAGRFAGRVIGSPSRRATAPCRRRKPAPTLDGERGCVDPMWLAHEERMRPVLGNSDRGFQSFIHKRLG
jgi:hypothetical protein